MKVAYVINSSDFFVSHFLVLAESVILSGAKVCVICGDDNSRDKIEACGINFIKIDLSRSGVNPLKEIVFIFNLFKVLRSIKADLVHSFTIKPVIYVGSLMRLFPFLRPSTLIASITGLGSASLSKSIKGNLAWFFLKKAYRFALSLKSLKVVFENDDDRSLFCLQNIVAPKCSFLVNGAGVDTSLFSPLNQVDKPSLIGGPLIVVLVARLLRDKGVAEYIEAGKALKKMGSNVRLLLVGSVDSNNISSMSKEEIDYAHQQGYVKYLGHSNNVSSIYQQAHVACLPSYREGLPKSLIEAASCGLAIVTSDVPGCRQMVFDGKNGLLFPARDSGSIVSTLVKLESDRALLNQMGKASREIALALFSHEVIVRAFFELYGLNNKEST
ncbi:glycosyltransferase family 4 protein [Vibrio rhodolitus]|uniref:glycosyltransferase family 4 protein n=1 Tax=Vibrio rhodolitus TaxID=2231649 RepID=UPI0013DE922C|nr:glycosyltransferase family 4 protein [Vibrio rhodolitus]